MKTYGFKDVQGAVTDPELAKTFGLTGGAFKQPSRRRGERAILAAKQPNRTVSCQEARELSKQPGTRIFWRRPGAGDTAEILEG